MNLYTQAHNTINGRGVWLYLLDSPIGYIFVVDYETPAKELKRFIWDGNRDKAERKFKSLCKGILNGTL